MKYTSSALEALKAMARKATEINENVFREQEESLRTILENSLLICNIDQLRPLCEKGCERSLAAFLQAHLAEVKAALSKYLEDKSRKLEKENASLQLDIWTLRKENARLKQDLFDLRESPKS